MTFGIAVLVGRVLDVEVVVIEGLNVLVGKNVKVEDVDEVVKDGVVHVPFELVIVVGKTPAGAAFAVGKARAKFCIATGQK
jgi:hypothetical protein